VSPDGIPYDHVALVRAAWERERPDLDVRPQGVIGRLHRLAGDLTDELVAVYREHGLSEGEFDVLATLRRAGSPYECSAGELAEHTMVTSGGMSKRLDALQARGLVTRRPSASDGRGRVVGLTARGREVIDAAFTDHIANEHRLLAMITPAQADALEELLRAWLAGFESPAAGRGLVG
jgi:DNA-binding MarR family transcriptional regulator